MAGILVGFVNVISNNLSSLAAPYVQIVVCFQNETQRFMNTLSTVKSVLLDLEEQQEMSHADKDWLEKLRDILYDADDLVDAFATKALRKQLVARSNAVEKVRSVFSTVGYYVVSAYKLKDIRDRLDDAATDRIKFHPIRQIVRLEERNRERDETYSYVIETNVIGRDDDKNHIVELIMDTRNEEHVSVISIIGIGGVGKTTLAKMVQNDEKIKKAFEPRLWVSISNVFDVKLIVQKIIESVTGKKCENYEMEQLKALLEDEIGRKRYLLVLDDVWNEDRAKWLSLMDLLTCSARGSKVLLTTRMELVAAVAAGKVPPYVLEGLSEDMSWSLFRKLAFRPGQEIEKPGLETIGKEIVRKCAGNPLAIRAIGALLYSKDTDSEWLSFKNNELSKLAENEDVKIIQILKLSYDHLPSRLKSCFAYCSLFPKNCVIDKQTLVNLWIAQGYVQPQYINQFQEDASHVYFMDLLRRSFLQDIKKDDLGNIVSCKMHDLFHDLAQSVAMVENSLVDADANANAEIVSERTRHISFGYNLGLSREIKIPTGLLKENKIRTLLLPVQPAVSERALSKSTCSRILSSSKCLRVLDLHNSGIDMLPMSISKLQHLRYLDLSNSKLTKLPKSIARLLNLQTLKLSNCYDLQKLPRHFRNMVGLRHLDLHGCENLIHMPRGLGQLTSLQTLTHFVVGKGRSVSAAGGLGELNSLANLRGELTITKLRYLKRARTEPKEVYLKNKEYLQSLRLEWEAEANGHKDDAEKLLERLEPHSNLKKLLVKGYWGVSFPSWMMVNIGSNLPNLVEITIKDCNKCQHLPSFGELPCLKVLNIANLPSLEYIDDHSEESSTYFPSLKELKLNNLPDLKNWWRMEDSGTATTELTGEKEQYQQQEQQLSPLPTFPCLSKSTIEFCPKLASMPVHPCVEVLSLHRASEKLLRQQFMMMKMTAAPTMVPSSSSSSSPAPSKLKSLYILGVKDLETLPEEGLQNLSFLEHLEISWCSRLLNLPEEGLRGLGSLQFLRIRRCEKLSSLSRGLEHLTALRTLKISDCKELDFSGENDGNGMQFQGLRSLTSLFIDYLPKLVSLPMGLQHVTTLRSLQIGMCNNLLSLPEWIGSLKLLHELHISDCPKLAALPTGIRELTSLQELTVLECQQLYESCQMENGKDWPKIAHIPKVVVQLRLPQTQGSTQV